MDVFFYRGKNKYAVMAMCIAGWDEFVFKHKPVYVTYFGGGSKLIKISLEEWMPFRPP